MSVKGVRDAEQVGTRWQLLMTLKGLSRAVICEPVTERGAIRYGGEWRVASRVVCVLGGRGDDRVVTHRGSAAVQILNLLGDVGELNK